MINTKAIREQFPSLHNLAPDGTQPIFFDNPAGTQVPQAVIDSVTGYYGSMNANSGGAFATSQRTDETVHAARETVADFLNAPSPDEIVFGPNMTTLNFALSRAIARTLPDDAEIVVTRMDHDANIAPWLLIAEDRGLTVRWVDVHTSDCTLDMDSLEEALTEKTKVVATVHASNAVGTINPVSRIADMAHAAGAYYVLDAVQSAPHIPIDVLAIGCDFLLCSAYKFYGPHIGVLWGKYDLLERLPAYKVRPAKNKTPHRWETGTQSFETINGTMAALNYIADIGRTYGDPAQFTEYKEGRRRDFKAAMTVLSEYEREMVANLIAQLQTLPGISIAGITDPARYHERVPTVAFSMDGHTPRAIAEHAAADHIYLWDGNYYALAIMERLGKEQEGGMVRVGLAHYNTKEEVDRLIGSLGKLS
ncbi:MAG: cysteine desulfurase-like protein [Chloroflexi bacterium]|nr:cysteine desulfurase-like protein [Chloroflexota bacterium]